MLPRAQPVLGKEDRAAGVELDRDRAEQCQRQHDEQDQRAKSRSMHRFQTKYARPRAFSGSAVGVTSKVMGEPFLEAPLEREG